MVKTSDDTTIVVGIDISKDWLDVFIHPDGNSLRLENVPAGWRTLIRQAEQASSFRVVYEATGPYHRGLERALQDKGIAAARLDARKARHFAESLGILAKTDKVDAAILARYGAFLQPAPLQTVDKEQEKLKELISFRRGLMQQKSRINNRCKSAFHSLIKRQLGQAMNQLQRHLQQIDEECLAIIRKSETLSMRLDILLSIPAVGQVTALALIADMPELGTLNEKQAASLSGLAPVARESGSWTGKRHIRGGRATVRMALYMAALVASRSNPDYTRKYQQMISQGKMPKVALTAIMRKIIILANALIRDQRKWQPKPA